MKIFNKISGIKDYLVNTNKKINFVPTMGNLHQGHLNLVTEALEPTKLTVVSIFVNDLQFGPNEDLATYPRTLENDLSLLETLGVDVVFCPNSQEMFPNGADTHTYIKTPKISELHCGNSRPIFFQGICTVVTKLFNIIKPNTAFFGEKDWQQYIIIKKLCEDLHINVNIKAVPITREANGLAMSSRNNYLNYEQKEMAALLRKNLVLLKNSYLQGKYKEQLSQSKENLKKHGFSIDYISMIDENTLLTAAKKCENTRILAAVYFDKIRLIDNIAI